MTEAIFIEVRAKEEAAKAAKRRVSVSGMLRILGVSRSGYRAFVKRRPSRRELRKNRLKKRIMQIYHASYQNYGAPKITESLRQEGEVISERTVGKYMKEMGIRAQWVRHRTRTTRDSDYSTELHNILNEDFHPHRPNEAWCTDITYIWTQAGFVYLCSVMDLFSRRIIAWSLSKTLDASSVVDAINLAKARRNVTSPLILHSDRGCQYTSAAYREASAGFRLSYSKKGYPYDNACMEAFHSLIKREWLDRVLIRDFQHAYSLVFEYIETFYNTVRIHSHCGFLSPLCFESRSSLPRHS